MTLNKETSIEIFENKMPFSVLLCMRVYKVRNTDSDMYEIEFIDVWKHATVFIYFTREWKSLQKQNV